MNIEISGENIKVLIIRKKRKTISIKVSEDCKIVVSAPLFISDGRIKEILMEKDAWILENLRVMEDRKKEVKDFKEGILYLGNRYKLNLHRIKFKASKIIFDKESFNIYIPETNDDRQSYELIKDVMTKWYRDKAEVIFRQRADYYAGRLEVSVNRISVKDQKSRWGSCSSMGNINLNYRLIMAPMEIIDYVIVHELCHLVYMNHSKEFWKLVEDFCPRYKEYKEWLKINGNKLKL